MAFAEPEENGRIFPKDILGHLLMVWSVGYIAHSPTSFTKPGKLSDVIVVDVVDLDQIGEDGQPGLLVRRAWWRQTKLIMSLKGRLGKPDPVLARMIQGKPTKGLPPFELASATADAEAVRRGTAWLTSHPGFIPSELDIQQEIKGELAAGQVEVDAMTHHGAAADQPAWSQPQPQATTSGTSAQETYLEKLARQSAEGAARLPAARPADVPPY
jgi:hypothetical protein